MFWLIFGVLIAALAVLFILPSSRLTAIGRPPYRGRNWRSKYMTERRILGKYGGEYYGSRIGASGAVLRHLVLSREYTMVDRLNYFRGILQSVEALNPELSRTDLFAEVPEVKVPVLLPGTSRLRSPVGAIREVLREAEGALQAARVV